ncbi:histidinol-phosphate transaminase [uncultured Sulfitobacter sp.]|uniref:pyridoxal phosphate-dependent aminotransferase n=1 Tax=uncultured Sulfitobacter sp. TaxID=191468 RepID=UPI002610F4A4|nr:histidinol-phosphate transaminase [uncultured Sulfitobacter sp.]
MRPAPYLEPTNLRGRINRPQPKGLPVINVGFNELPYPPLESVLQAIETAAKQGQSYGSPHCDALRDALASRNGIDAEQIVCGNGSEELLDVVARCFARTGDEILISQYGYIQFELTTKRVGATLVKAPEVAFTSSVDALLAAVTPKTRVVFLANPNNPTGTLIPVPELHRLADGLPRHVILVLDLAYGEFAVEGYCADVHRLVDAHENVIITRTFSKAYGLAGLRAGWCHASAWMIPILYAARGMGTVNALAQAAANAVLAEQEQVDARVATIISERTRIAGALGQLGLEVVPSHANFLMARIRDASPQTTEKLVEHLFDQEGFIVNRTREQGLEPFFRFSLHLPENNDRLVDCIRSFQDARQVDP